MLHVSLTTLTIVCAKCVAGSLEVVILAELDAALLRLGTDGEGIFRHCHGNDKITTGSSSGCSLRCKGRCRCRYGGGREDSHGEEGDEGL